MAKDSVKCESIGPYGLGLSIVRYLNYPTRTPHYCLQVRGKKRRVGNTKTLTEEQAIKAALELRSSMLNEQEPMTPMLRSLAFRPVSLEELLSLRDIPGVYKLKLGEKLRYIGSSMGIGRRVGQHMSQAAIDFSAVEVLTDFTDQRKWVEARLIDLEQPPDNFRRHETRR